MAFNCLTLTLTLGTPKPHVLEEQFLLPFDFYFIFPVKVSVMGLDLQTVPELQTQAKRFLPPAVHLPWRPLFLMQQQGSHLGTAPHPLPGTIRSKRNQHQLTLTLSSVTNRSNTGAVSLMVTALRLTAFERGIGETAGGAKYFQHLSLTSYHSH